VFNVLLFTKMMHCCNAECSLHASRLREIRGANPFFKEYCIENDTLHVFLDIIFSRHLPPSNGATQLSAVISVRAIQRYTVLACIEMQNFFIINVGMLIFLRDIYDNYCKNRKN
jgi:hypothetical protein